MTVNQLQLDQVTRINKIFNSYGQKLGISSTQTTDASGTIRFFVKFNPSALYSGFINDQLAEFENVLKPLDSVFSLLTTTIPFVNDYKQYFKELDLDNDPNSITVLDVLGYIAKFKGISLDVKAIDEIISLGKLINKINTVVNSPDQIQSLGELTIDSLGMIDTANLKKDLISLPDIKLPNSFDIPLLKDSVTTIFGFLKGGNDPLTLFSYDAPEFILPQLDLGSIEFPVLGIVGGVIYPNIGAKIKLGFGFDTKGINSDNFQSGFFVKDYLGVPEVEVSGGFRVGLFAGIPKVATLNATLDPTLTLGFNIKDPTPNDGKVRLSEIDFSKPFGIFGDPTTSLSLASTANLDIAGASIAKGTTPSIKFDLGGFPPPEIQRQIDKIRGYIDQVQDLKDPSKIVARILTAVGDALNKAGGYIVESLDNLGEFTRKTADKFGNYVEERYENGKKTLQRVWNNAGDYIEDRAEQFGTYTRTKWEGAKSTVSEVGEALDPFNPDGGLFSLDGGNFIPQGDVVEFQGGKVSSIVKNGQKVLFDTFGNVVNETGVIIGDLVKGIITFRQGVGRSPIDLRPASSSSFSLIGVSVDIESATINQLYVVQQKLANPTRNIDYRADGSISLTTGNGADILEGTDLSDEFRGGDGNDYIDGKGGNDFIYGEGGDDTLIGGNGRDMLYGGQGSDTLKGGDEVDFLYGEVGNDQFFGGAGNDTIDGGADSDTVRYDDSPSGVNVNIKLGNASDGFGNIDTLINIENITGSNKNDVLIGNASANTINGLGGNDLLIGNGGNDILDGGDDIDTVQYDDDSTSGATVNIDESKGYINTNYAFTLRAFNIAAGKALDGFGDTDTLKNIENIVGSDNNDVLIGNGKDNVITGSKGDDILIGNGGDDTLNGGDNKDTLIGGANIDTLNGGSGDDQLFGGSGNDTIDGGADNDTVRYDDSTSGATVNIDESKGYSNTDYVFTLRAFNIATGKALDGFGDTDTLKNIENIVGSDKDDVLIGNEKGNTITGSIGDDILIGNGGTDTLNGGDDKDTLIGGGGIDTLNGGTGEDQLFGGSGNDTIDGGADNDTVRYDDSQNGTVVNIDESKATGYSNTDYTFTLRAFDIAAGKALDGFGGTDTLKNIENIVGSDKDDVLIGNEKGNTITGSIGDDILIGNGGTDTLNGSEGEDTLIGGEEIDNLNGGTGEDQLFGGQGNDIIDGGADKDTVRYDDSQNGTVVNIDENNGYTNAYSANIALFSFDIVKGEAQDGFDTIDTLKNLENITGSNSSDVLIGNEVDNIIKGLDGIDLLIGNGGLDTLEGGTGNDSFFGGKGNDIIDGGANTDTVLYDNSDNGVTVNIDETTDYKNTKVGIDIEPTFTINKGKALDGFGDTDTLTNLENIIGSKSNDILIGNEFQNTILGLTGDDLFIGNKGNDILDGGDDIDTVSYRRDPSRVIVDLSKQTATDGFGGTDTLLNIENVVGSKFDDEITGDAKNNTIIAGAGKDIVMGGTGDDLLKGEAGIDFIDGGTEIDTVIYDNSPKGVVVNIDEAQTFQSPGGILRQTVFVNSIIPTNLEQKFTIASGSAQDGFDTTDTLRNLENIIGSRFNDVLIGNSSFNKLQGLAGDDVFISSISDDFFDGGADTDTVSYRRDPSAVNVSLEQNKATDGFGNTDQLFNIENVIGTTFSDLIVGDAKNNTIFAGASDDTVNARDGNDILFGEAGRDNLFGENGDDFLVGGTEADLLDGGNGNDTASYFDATSGVEISLETGESFLGDANGDRLVSIENIEGSEFSDLLIGNQENNIFSGIGGDDRLYGQTGDDTLYGGAGRDRLYGGEGNDSLFGGDDNDVLYGLEGNDLLDGGAGDDQLYGGEGNDIIRGGLGIDTAVYNGRRSRYSITRINGGFTITSNDTGEGVDTLSNDIEKLQFSDQVEELRSSDEVIAINPVIPKPNGDVFGVINGSKAQPSVQFTINSNATNQLGELGVFVVDDTDGKIDGIAPNDIGYAQKALSKSKVIFSVIDNNPNGFSSNGLSRLLEFNTNAKFRFYVIGDRTTTTDSVLASGNLSKVNFSTATLLNFNENTFGSFINFNNLIINVKPSDDELPIGTGLQDQKEGEVLDLTKGFDTSVFSQVKADFTVNREASFNNFVGFYKIENTKGDIKKADGSIVSVGQSGYIQAAVASQVSGIDLSVDNQSTKTTSGIFKSGSIFAPFIIVNGTRNAILDNNPNNDPAVYFPFLGANSDKVDHIRLLGNNTFGFEDLAGGGDFDYNDIIVKVNLTPIA